jgi:hypothetical protein
MSNQSLYALLRDMLLYLLYATHHRSYQDLLISTCSCLLNLETIAWLDEYRLIRTLPYGGHQPMLCGAARKSNPHIEGEPATP